MKSLANLGNDFLQSSRFSFCASLIWLGNDKIIIFSFVTIQLQLLSSYSLCLFNISTIPFVVIISILEWGGGAFLKSYKMFLCSI
jgi:hypothetical protein